MAERYRNDTGGPVVPVHLIEGGYLMFSRLCGPVGLLLWAVAAVAWAGNGVRAPEEIPGVVRLDAEGLIETVRTVEGLVLIDSRIAMDRKQGYIEGSVSLPDVETDCESLAVVIPARTHPVLFYCNGPKCGRSVAAIRIAQACGYSNLYWFRGGFKEWSENGYPFLKE